MHHRVPLLPLLALLAALLPGSALAHGPILRGEVISTNVNLIAKTDKESDLWRWYTVGLKPGQVSVTATLRSFSKVVAPTWGIEVFLEKNGSNLQTGTAACYARNEHCGQSLHFGYRIARAGVYYLLIQGLGATGISFRLTVHGHMYPLHCHKYC